MKKEISYNLFKYNKNHLQGELEFLLSISKKIPADLFIKYNKEIEKKLKPILEIIMCLYVYEN